MNRAIMKLLIAVLVIAMVIMLKHHSNAQTRNTAAVIDLRANNCPETLAKAATDILINRI